MFLTRSCRVLVWRLTLVFIALVLILNFTYFYFEKTDSKYNSKRYAIIEDIIKQQGKFEIHLVSSTDSKKKKTFLIGFLLALVGLRASHHLDRILVVSYSGLGSNLSQLIMAHHPEVWFWQPYSLKLVSKQHATLDLVIQQANVLVSSEVFYLNVKL